MKLYIYEVRKKPYRTYRFRPPSRGICSGDIIDTTLGHTLIVIAHNKDEADKIATEAEAEHSEKITYTACCIIPSKPSVITPSNGA